MADKAQDRVPSPDVSDLDREYPPPVTAAPGGAPEADGVSDLDQAYPPLKEPGPPTYEGLPPGYEPPTGFIPASNMATGRFISHIPLIGPPIKAAIDYALWGPVGSQSRNELAAQQQHEVELHPNVAAGADIAGTASGLALAAYLAPEAMGMAAADPWLLAAGKAGVTSAFLLGTNSLLDSAMQGKDVEDALKKATSGEALDKAQGEAFSGLAGGMGGTVAGRMVGALFANTIKPGVAALVQKAINDYGIKITPNMFSQNPMLKFARGVLPFGTKGDVANQAAREGEFWTATTGQMGEPSTSLTTDVMENAAKNIGARYDAAKALAIQPMAADLPLGQVWTDLRAGMTQKGFGRVWQPGEQEEVQALMDHVGGVFKANGGAINGQLYKKLTETGSMLDSAMHSNLPNIAQAAEDIDNGLKQWFIRKAPPEASNMMQTADRQWRSMRILEDVAKRYPNGDAPPEALWDAVLAATKRQTIAGSPVFNGGGPMGVLARIGQGPVARIPSKGGWAHALDIAKFLPTIGAGVAHGGLLPGAAAAYGPAGTLVGAGASAGGYLGSLAGRSTKLGGWLTRAATGTPPWLMQFAPTFGQTAGVPAGQAAGSEFVRAQRSSPDEASPP